MIGILKHPISTFCLYKASVLCRSPNEKIVYIRKWASFVLSSIGIPYTNPGFKVWWLSYTVLIVSINFFVTSVYTCWYYVQDHKYIKGIAATCPFGIAIPVCIQKCMKRCGKPFQSHQRVDIFYNLKINEFSFTFTGLCHILDYNDTQATIISIFNIFW